jgi:hypothetical protein
MSKKAQPQELTREDFPADIQKLFDDGTLTLYSDHVLLRRPDGEYERKEFAEFLPAT